MYVKLQLFFVVVGGGVANVHEKLVQEYKS